MASDARSGHRRSGVELRYLVFTMVRQATYDLGLVNGRTVPEPGTQGHLDYDAAGLVVLNADINSSPFGQIRLLRTYPPVQ